MREYPDGARGMSHACHENMFHRPVGHVRSPQLMSRWNALRAIFETHACKVGLPQMFTHLPNTVATAGHVPHVALRCARVCWMVVEAIRDQTSDVCINQNTSGNSHSGILRTMDVGDSLMIMPHLIVDVTTG